MVFRSSLSFSKAPQVSRTFLSILGILNYGIVWMVFTHPLSSMFSSPFNNPVVTVPKTPITVGIIVTFMFESFSIPKQGSGTYYSFHFLSNFILWSARTAKSTILQIVSFFFLDYCKVWSSDRDYVISLYVKIPWEFICLIPQGRCWVVHIPLVRMIKFKFHTQLPLYHLAYLDVSSLLLFVFFRWLSFLGYLVVCLNSKRLHNCQGITFPIQSYLV